MNYSSQILFWGKIYLFLYLFSSDLTLVNVCPNTEHDNIQASRRLGCGNDRYGNNQYMCIPNKKKTSLVEFCFQGVMGIVQKGTLNNKKEI